MHMFCLRKANSAAHQALDPRPQVDVLALDPLRVLFADGVLLWGDMPLLGPPPIGVEVGDAKRFQESLEVQKDADSPRIEWYNFRPLIVLRLCESSSGAEAPPLVG